jgi:hypothetical protein
LHLISKENQTHKKILEPWLSVESW